MAREPNQRQDWIRSRRQRRKGAKAARLRRQILRYILLAIMLYGSVFLFQHTQWTLANSKTDIIIHGNSVATNAQIKAKLAQFLQMPIYKIEPKAVEKKISELAAVKYAFVRRYALPKPKLVIEVLEEYPWATFAQSPDDEPEAIIAQSGRMIPISEFPAIPQPALKIYGLKNCKFNSAEVSQWASWCDFISDQTKEPVDYVDMRKPFEVIVQDGDLMLKLGTPDTTLTRRLGRLSSVMAAIEPLRSRLEYVDLGLDNNIPLRVAKKPGEQKQNI
jgi:cell division septal protein FtsQ